MAGQICLAVGWRVQEVEAGQRDHPFRAGSRRLRLA